MSHFIRFFFFHYWKLIIFVHKYIIFYCIDHFVFFAQEDDQCVQKNVNGRDFRWKFRTHKHLLIFWQLPFYFWPKINVFHWTWALTNPYNYITKMFFQQKRREISSEGETKLKRFQLFINNNNTLRRHLQSRYVRESLSVRSRVSWNLLFNMAPYLYPVLLRANNSTSDYLRTPSSAYQINQPFFSLRNGARSKKENSPCAKRIDQVTAHSNEARTRDLL